MAMVKKVYAMEDLDCANCARKMQDAVNKLDGVESCEVNFMLQKMTLEFDEDSHDKVIKQVKKCVRRVEPDCTVLFD
ncbi:MAG: heavy-metal-associated domain-containing protein [Ruminococcus sp.]|nr:heavy-metal-associated domain-containing protein [Ruminococcus sp.]